MEFLKKYNSFGGRIGCRCTKFLGVVDSVEFEPKNRSVFSKKSFKTLKYGSKLS